MTWLLVAALAVLAFQGLVGLAMLMAIGYQHNELQALKRRHDVLVDGVARLHSVGGASRG